MVPFLILLRIVHEYVEFDLLIYREELEDPVNFDNEDWLLGKQNSSYQ
jgi:hypothetical protein